MPCRIPSSVRWVIPKPWNVAGSVHRDEFESFGRMPIGRKLCPPPGNTSRPTVGNVRPSMRAKKGKIMIANSTRRSIARISTRLTSDDRGMTTAEYAVGTVAAVGLGGLLLKLLTSSQIGELIWSIIRAALSAFL